MHPTLLRAAEGLKNGYIRIVAARAGDLKAPGGTLAAVELSDSVPQVVLGDLDQPTRERALALRLKLPDAQKRLQVGHLEHVVLVPVHPSPVLSDDRFFEIF